jgi:RHS repeat-associated protein/uncharacterized delta-60 repeat protein
MSLLKNSVVSRLVRGLVGLAVFLSGLMVSSSPPAEALGDPFDRGFAGTGFRLLPVETGAASSAWAIQMAVDPRQNQVVVFARIGPIASSTPGQVTRILSDGTPDPSFGGGDGVVPFTAFGTPSGARSLKVQSDGKIVLVAGTNVARLNVDGTLDPSFGVNGVASFAAVPNFEIAPGSMEPIQIGPDGSIFVLGYSLAFWWSIPTQIVKLTPAGALDTSFDNDGFVAYGTEWPASFDVRADGKVVLLSGSNYRVLSATGVLETHRVPQAGVPSYVVWTGVLPNNDVVVLSDYVNSARRLVYLKSDGTIDSTRPATPAFATMTPNWVWAVHYQPFQAAMGPDGSIYVTYENKIWHVYPNGKIDTGFNSTGLGYTQIDVPPTTGADTAVGMAIDSAGKPVVIAGPYVGKLKGYLTTPTGYPNGQDQGTQGVGRVGVADPVDTRSGNLVDVSTDLGGEAFGLDVTRAYNGLSVDAGVLGDRWSITTGTRMTVDGDGLSAVTPDGTWFRFAPTSATTWARAKGYKATLSVDPAVAVGGGTLPMLRLTHDDGTVERFDTLGRLIQTSNWDGTSATTVYDAQGRIATVTASTGRSLTFTYNATSGRLTGITSSTGRIVAYGYNTLGQLSSVTDEHNAAWVYTYTPTSGLLKTATDPTGVLQMDNQYDIYGRVITQTGANGGVTTFAYNDATSVTSVHDSLTNTTVLFQHDVEGKVVGMTDPFGKGVARVYDAQSNLKSATSRDGTVAMADYDPNGNVTKMTEPGVGDTLYEYDTLNRVKKVTDPWLQSTTFTYDADERIPMTVTNALNQTTTYNVVDGLVMWSEDADGVRTTNTYNTLRQLTSTADEFLNTTLFEYDTKGRRAKVTSPSSRITIYSYNAAGFLGSMTAPDGGITSYTYDNLGRTLTTIDPVGAVTTNVYNTAGQLTSVTAPNGSVTTMTYDANGQLLSTIEPGGGTRSTTYGALGRVTGSKDQLNRISGVTYDDEGRPKTSTAPDGGVVTKFYNAAGQVTKTVDPANRETTTAYDTHGRVQSTTAPGARVTTYTYDVLGRVTGTLDPRGATTATTFTSAGRTLTTTDQAGLVTTYAYDNAGRLATVTAPGNRVVAYTYNAESEVATMKSPSLLTTAYTYDAGGRVATITDPAGVVTTRTWSTRGELLTEKVGAGGTVTYVYNPAGTLASVTDAVGKQTTFGPTTTYTYTPAGQLATMTDTTGSYTYTYDQGGLPTSETTPTGRATRWTYDTAGRRSALTYPDGATVKYGYNTIGQLATITPGEVLADTFTRSVTTVDTAKWTITPTSGGTATVAANAMSLNWTTTAGSSVSAVSTAAATADHEVSFTYKFAQTATNTARLDAKVKSSGAAATLQEVRIEIAAGATTGTVFKQIGTVSTSAGTFAVPGGTGTTGLRINMAGTTVKVKAWNTTSPEPVAWTTTITGVTGVTTAGVAKLAATRTAGAGSVVVDDWSQVNPTTPPAADVTYTYNTDGQITNEALIGGTRAYTYTTGRLTTFNESLPGLTRLTTLTYDTTGRISTEATGGVTTTYTYDTASQLLSATPTAGTVNAWTYDNLGRRATETSGPVGGAQTTTKYLYDPASQLCWTTTGTLPATPLCTAPPSGATSYTYDAAGKQLTEFTTATNKITNTYNPSGQLATATRVNGTTTTAHARTYTPDGRLLTTSAAINGGGTNVRTYDWDVTGGTVAGLLSFTTGSGGTRDFVQGPAGWVSTRNNATPRAIGTDIYGSVLATTSVTDLARGTSYTAYGNPTGTSTFDPKLGYRGELQHDTLLHLRARNYQPGLGQFTSRDPLPGVTGTTTLTNPYHYVDGRPLQASDPSGMQPEDELFESFDGVPAWQLKYLSGQQMSTLTAALAACFHLGYETCMDYTANPQVNIQENLIAHELITWGLANGRLRLDGDYLLGNTGSPFDNNQIGIPAALFPNSNALDLAMIVGLQTPDGLGGARSLTTGFMLATLLTKSSTKPTVIKEVRPGATPRTTTGGLEPVLKGQAGEAAVRRVYDIGPKATAEVGGRTRIFDGLTDFTVTEVKYVKKQSFTLQLKDSLSYAQSTGRRFDLFVDANTKLSKPLARAIADGLINIELIPW